MTCFPPYEVTYITDSKDKVLYSLSYSTALVPNAGSNHVYLICVFIRFNISLLRKVKYCISLLKLFVSLLVRLSASETGP